MSVEPKRIVVVLGMHRSGTSAITRGLQVLGVDLGARLLAAEAGINDKGFWEDGDITAFNVDLLAAMGHDWHTLTPITPIELENPAIEPFRLRAVQLLRSKLTAANTLGLKDPRMPRVMPFWVDVFKHLQLDVSYVIACRNPMSVVHSLATRNGFALEKSYLLWLEHTLFAMKYTAQARRVFVDYDLMLSEPQRQLERIAAALDLPFCAESEAFAEYRNEFLETALRHNGFVAEDLALDPAVTEEVQQLHLLVTKLAGDKVKDDEQVAEQVESLYGSISGRHAAYRFMRALEDRGNHLALRLDEAETTAASLTALVNETREALAASRQGSAVLGIQLDEAQAALADLTLQLADQTADMQHLDHALKASRTGRASFKNLLRALVSRIGIGRLQQRHTRNRLFASGLFDTAYYRSAYPDVVAAGIEPLDHFLQQGWKEGRNPSSWFSTTGYLQLHDDVRLLGVNPALHYLKHGCREGRMVPAVSGGVGRLPLRRSMIVRLATVLKAEPGLIVRFFVEARRNGLRHALRLAHKTTARQERVDYDTVTCGKALESSAEYDLYNIVPYYLNPYQHDERPVPAFKLGIHLHLFYTDMAEECIGYLSNIPQPFDLYVSVSEQTDASVYEALLKSRLPLAREVIVEPVPNRGRDLAALIVQFGERLVDYDIVAHFHTSRSPHKQSVNGLFGALMNALCGTRSSVFQILSLFSDDAKIVYPAGRQNTHRDNTGWGDNKEMVKSLLARHTDIDSADFSQVEFPHGSMFWGKVDALREFLSLPLTYEDFAEEPIAPDATLVHALERSILIFGTRHEGRNYRIEMAGLSNEPQQYYEDQYDFSTEIVHDTIKVLAYYLPQFHPTPENDAWHGSGFTEWHKVAAANPLFLGHYQQHVPHADIGYYHLDCPAQLEKQADMMKQSGVTGLIFYHYWFSGKLILEKPAQMLLDNPDINMPFSFCWANENWTRRWDGNEKEILLGQVYSPDDAVGFIRYLIPFFKDERYIKVDGRPLLFVYRPSAMEGVDDYLRIWREECERSGLPAPYVVATLTRGAVSPAHYGMDAAVERPLHDWTDGAVADIRQELKPYGSINGSFLDYSEVADHYMHKELESDGVLFRSLVPTWDNTPRYGSEAIGLHRFTTAKFQEWFEHLIRYSIESLPADRRFVVVNAWNEWAEGAHLEPDTRFGYGYLNSIGRGLCNYSFGDTQHLAEKLGPQLVLRLELAEGFKQDLAADNEAQRKFLHCLSHSTIFQKCTVVSPDADVSAHLATLGINCTECSSADPDYTLRFDEPYLFTASCIESLLLMALRHPGFSISPSVLNDPAYLHDPQSVNFEVDYALRAGMEIKADKVAFKGYKVAWKAACFRLPVGPAGGAELPRVATVMRFHRQGSMELLANALLSLATQASCRVQLHLALQDLGDDELSSLNAMLAGVPWAVDCQPVIRRYCSSDSNPDLRSVMLNETLKAIGTGYAAFLDYDDVLFPNAYQHLVGQLQASGKNASFARVYATRVDVCTGMILKRESTYDYGFSYEDFYSHNHAPLHSFMLNLDKIDLGNVHYHHNMKFMEDYYLTLQLFTKAGTDWSSLHRGEFIGDYLHRVGGDSNTLALLDNDERQSLLQNEHYVLCEARINALRRKLGG